MSDSLLHPDRLFPSDDTTRKIARELYAEIKNLPIISPHGHTDPAWFADNENFSNPTELLVKPDHYVFRMLFSQGVSLESLGIGESEKAKAAKPEDAWRIFAQHYHLFRGTPSRMWLDYVFENVFGFTQALNESTADHYYRTIDDALLTDAFKPRALFERFNIEVIATTESPVDPLPHHQKLAESDWKGRVITAFRPDNVVDPEFEGFAEHVATMGSLANEDVSAYAGYLKALQNRREYFKGLGATSTDHGHASAFTADLDKKTAEDLYLRALAGKLNTREAEMFRGHMLTEMVGMSLDDGLVVQLHPGCYRNHNTWLFNQFGRDKGADIPLPTEYVRNLHAVLNRYGNNPDLSLIVFTLDETSYSRELAPLAGHYPLLKLGPAWWFHDSPEGMRRFRQQTTETAGFYNTVGFNDDTRAFTSIPARHDVARRIDCGFLAELVAEHRLRLDEAHDLAHDLTYRFAKAAYKL